MAVKELKKKYTSKEPSKFSFTNIYKSANSEDDPIEDTKHPTWTQNLRYYFAEYCAASSIHGVQYLGERGRFISEKLTWSIILIGVWYFGIMLIVKSYNKWVISPVIVTFATTETPISKIPFPAVTICPAVKSDPEIFNYTDVLLRKVRGTELQTDVLLKNAERNLTDDQIQKFNSFSLICTGLDKLMIEAGYMKQGEFIVDGHNLINDLTKTHPHMHPVSHTMWLGDVSKINKLLSETISSSGLCYSFNMLHYSEILKEFHEYSNLNYLNNSHPRNWSPKYGYSNDLNANDTFPKRSFRSGIDGGFQAIFVTNTSHLDNLCGAAMQGFQVTLHHPSELPNMDQHFYVPLDRAVFVAIKPRMITVSEALSSYKPEDRKCYLPDEKYLSLFKTYTQQNCFDECLTNYTLSICGCVAFYMPKLASFPICGPGSIDCLELGKMNFISDQEIDCSCFPSCVSLEYDIEISQTDWNWREWFQVFNRLIGQFDKSIVDYKKSHVSRLAVYYKEMQFLTSQRNELYGIVDFFSSTGGLLGLFIGVSVTSVIEIIYFLTFRLACNIRRFGRYFWSGDPGLIKAKSEQ